MGCILGKFFSRGRRGDLMVVSALDSGWNGPGSGPDGGHCGKTFYSHGASLYLAAYR